MSAAERITELEQMVETLSEKQYRHDMMIRIAGAVLQTSFDHSDEAAAPDEAIGEQDLAATQVEVPEPLARRVAVATLDALDVLADVQRVCRELIVLQHASNVISDGADVIDIDGASETFDWDSGMEAYYDIVCAIDQVVTGVTAGIGGAAPSPERVAELRRRCAPLARRHEALEAERQTLLKERHEQGHGAG